MHCISLPGRGDVGSRVVHGSVEGNRSDKIEIAVKVEIGSRSHNQDRRSVDIAKTDMVNVLSRFQTRSWSMTDSGARAVSQWPGSALRSK